MLSTPFKLTHLFAAGAVLATASIASAGGFNEQLEEHSATYKELSNDVITRTVSGDFDADQLNQQLEQIIKIGVWYAQRYQEAYPEGERMMQILIDEAATVDADGNVTGLGNMTTLSLEDIEHNWHDKAIFTQPGFELPFDHEDEDFEHFTNPFDAVVHPATAVILLREFESSKDEAHLRQVKAELIEVLEHLDLVDEYLKKKAGTFAQVE